jgi:hypothetical protein
MLKNFQIKTNKKEKYKKFNNYHNYNLIHLLVQFKEHTLFKLT